MLHVQFVALLIRSISLEVIFIVVPRLALHLLLTRAKLLALAKSIYYIGMPVVRTDGRSGGRSVGVRSRDYQIFSDG